MKRIYGLVTVAVLGLLLAACQTEPIYQAQHPITQAGNLQVSEQKVEKGILAALGQEGEKWTVESTQPSKIMARWRRHGTRWALVAITYNSRSFNITLDSSANLYQENGVIHPSYNEAVRALETAIDHNVQLILKP